MLNQVILVGRLVKEVEVKKLEDGKREANVTLAIPRSWKNSEGLYDTDFIDCIIYDSVADNTSEYCHKGDIIGIKGRVQSKKYPREDGSSYNVTEIIAEKVTFLSSKKVEE